MLDILPHNNSGGGGENFESLLCQLSDDDYQVLATVDWPGCCMGDVRPHD